MIKGMIYIIFNSINKKVYIGQTVKTLQERFKSHKYASQYERCSHYKLYRAFSKYGIKNFSIALLEEVSCEISEREKFWIKFYNSFNNGYNSTIGGESMLGFKHSNNTKRKISEKLLGRIVTEETKNKLSKSLKEGYSDGTIIPSMLGKSHSNKTKIKMRNSHKGELNPMFGRLHFDQAIEKMNGRISPRKGIKLSEEVKNKISISHSGKKLTEEHKKNISISNKGKQIGSKNSQSKLKEKDVIEIKKMLKNGKSNREIGNIYNVDPSHIWSIKKGKSWSHIK